MNPALANADESAGRQAVAFGRALHLFRERPYTPLSARFLRDRNVPPDHGGRAAYLRALKESSVPVDIREFQDSDLSFLIELTIEAFRPLFERHWPDLMSPRVFAHDHADWEAGYRREVPALHDPQRHRFVTLAEEHGRILGYVGWNVINGDSGRLQMVAVHPECQGRGVGTALCRFVLDRMRAQGVVVVHIGTGGDDFHARARRLYESLGFTGLPVVDYTKAL